MLFNTDAVWEFFSPFAHVPGRYEWCRIHSPTHGSFDTFIVLGVSTAHPPTVYVNSEAGRAFMADRYGESRCIQVSPTSLRIAAEEEGAAVLGILEASEGPVRSARMRLAADAAAVPKAVPYGGADFPVWGSRWSCEGIDLNRDGVCDGELVHSDGRRELFRGEPCIVAAGSVAMLRPLAASAG